jgi:hypothetical protein
MGSLCTHKIKTACQENFFLSKADNLSQGNAEIEAGSMEREKREHMLHLFGFSRSEIPNNEPAQKTVLA